MVVKVAANVPDEKLAAFTGAPDTASKVTLCVTPVVLLQVSVAPFAMVILVGLKVLLAVRHIVLAPGVQPIPIGGGFVAVASLPPHAANSKIVALNEKIRRVLIP